MKIIKSLRRKSLMFLLLTAVIVSSIPLGSTYATATDGLPESENPYHVEILPSEDNSYEGETQANFTVKVTYSGVDVIQKETVYLETMISDSVIASFNTEALSERRLDSSEFTGNSEWEESYSISLPALETDTEADYMVMLKDGEDNILASSNQRFTVKKSGADMWDTYANESGEEEVSPKSEGAPSANALRSYTAITGTLPNGISGLDKLYYGSVEKDDTAPFHNANELQDILENSDETYAREIWKKYQYDLYDPNFSGRGGCGALLTPSGEKYSEKNLIKYPDDRPDYADELLTSTNHEYPKDGDSPFHANVKSQIDAVKDGTLVNGALVENDESAFENLTKTASPDIGDSNTSREYTVDLKATPNLKQVKPTVLLFQIQTSWQMFDLIHANDRASLVNKNEVTKELLSLYEMKQGFLDFIEWMQPYTDGSLMIGITNYQHGGSNSMFGAPYFTNNTNNITEGLYGWDSFGDCEHIHYTNKALADAMKELNQASNFTNWADNKGNLIYQDAEMISVIVGGACEAKDLKTGSTKLPAIPDGVLKCQYGIRTNSGTAYGKNMLGDMISWMDYEAQGSGEKGDAPAFETGEYYKDVVTRDQFFETLKSIYADAQAKAPNMQKVTDVKVEDTITAEFKVDKSNIKAFVGGEDITSKAKITVEEQANGTTKVTCNFGTVEHSKEVHLQIPAQAKSNYIGSNNVYTNTGTPVISYKGRVNSSKTYTQNFTDNPAVNVPIRLTVADGQRIDLEPGQSVDLADLAKDTTTNELITKTVEDSLGDYAQIEGTLTYQWVDTDGNPIGNSATSIIDSGNRVPPTIPSYIVHVTENDIGKSETYKLKVTFTPADVKEETTSKVAVSAQSQTGDVGISVSQKPVGRVRIKKMIDNYDNTLANDEFMMRINSVSGTAVSSQVVLKHNETSGYVEIMEPTWLNIVEILPMEYSFIEITIEGTGADTADIKNGQVYVERGDDITITVHNKYSWNPFFHTFDSIMNVFKRT